MYSEMEKLLKKYVSGSLVSEKEIQSMLELIIRYIKLIFIGAFISVISLLFIIFNRYGNYNQGLELTIVLVSLSLFAVVSPFVLYKLALNTINDHVAGLLLLVLLFAELFFWVLMFFGISAFPSLKKSIYFFIPFALYVFSAGICLFLPPVKK